MKIDEVTRSVILNNLQWITEEMGEYLARAAFSTNIKIRRDCSCALYTANGDMLAQGTFVPVHLGIMAQTLKALLKIHPANTLKEGDALIHNDPYMYGSHLFDVMVFKPIFHNGKLFAFTGALAHQLDMGGSPRAFINETVIEEGLIIPGVFLAKEGVVQEDILDFITANVRTKYEVRGDLLSELAANNRGETRLKALAEKYGVDTLMVYFESILDYSEKSMREAIRAIPDCEEEFEDYLETDGLLDMMIKVKTHLKIEGSDIYVDFEGSSPPVPHGNNNPWSLTHSGTYFAIKAVLGNDLPTNAGAYRAIHLIRPKVPNFLDAPYPHAVGGCTTVPPQRIVDVIIGVLSKIVPEKCCACNGQWAGGIYGGIDPKTGRNFVYNESFGCGLGAKYNDDGASGHHSHMSNTANAPTEMIEMEYPIRVLQYSLVQDSGGVGKFRGGLGLLREVELLTETNVSMVADRDKIRPYGLFGGGGGLPNIHAGRFPDGSEHTIAAEKVPAGTITIQRTSGGGGWGDPRERDRDSLEWDVLNGYVSVEAAKRDYGVTIDPDTMKIIDE